MDIKIKWLNKGLHMEAENETGGKIRIDGNSQIGGLEGGMAPMQLLLAGIGGCSLIDALGILEKQREPLENAVVEVSGDKQKKGTYSEFSTIHMHYIFEGKLDENKVRKALELSITKYCSVSKALEKTSRISYDFEIR